MTHWAAGLPREVTVDVAEIKKLEPDVIIPMHCSGDNFARAVRAQLPDKLLVSTTGVRMTMGA